jgi:hypothetical protein
VSYGESRDVQVHIWRAGRSPAGTQVSSNNKSRQRAVIALSAASGILQTIPRPIAIHDIEISGYRSIQRFHIALNKF